MFFIICLFKYMLISNYIFRIEHYHPRDTAKVIYGLYMVDLRLSAKKCPLGVITYNVWIYQEFFSLGKHLLLQWPKVVVFIVIISLRPEWNGQYVADDKWIYIYLKPTLSVMVLI